VELAFEAFGRGGASSRNRNYEMTLEVRAIRVKATTRSSTARPQKKASVISRKLVIPALCRRFADIPAKARPRGKHPSRTRDQSARENAFSSTRWCLLLARG